MENKLVISKHNDLIDNFIFNATEAELQILNWCVAKSNPFWENKNLVYRIDIPELVKVYGTKSKNIYKLYREALIRLMDRKYSFYPEKNIKITENLVISVTENMSDNSYIEFTFNRYISERIGKLQDFFTSYNIKHIANFKSRYAFLLYEYFKMNLDQYHKALGENSYHIKMTVDEFREKLDLVDKYKVFAEVERNVLVKAKDNINAHSDIRISYKITRKAKTATHIVFTAQYKKNQSPQQLKQDPTIANQAEFELEPKADIQKALQASNEAKNAEAKRQADEYWNSLTPERRAQLERIKNGGKI
jgi:plasmid replication initiation protein